MSKLVLIHSTEWWVGRLEGCGGGGFDSVGIVSAWLPHTGCRETGVSVDSDGLWAWRKAMSDSLGRALNFAAHRRWMIAVSPQQHRHRTLASVSITARQPCNIIDRDH